MLCFLLLSSMPVYFYILLGLFFVLFCLQILRLFLFEKHKKRFNKRINKALLIQADVCKEKIKLYHKYSDTNEVVDEKYNLFALPEEENESHVFSSIFCKSNMPSKAYRVEIDHIKRDVSLDGPFEVHFSPGDCLVESWKLKEITGKEGIFEHPIMGVLKLKDFPQNLRIGDIVKIQQVANIHYGTVIVQYKVLD